jgi:hypothetical protein
MDHRLRLVLRLDADLHSAVVELRGCLTVPATSMVKRLLLSCRCLKDPLGLTLDLRAARHIEPAALTALSLPSVPQVPSATLPGTLELNTTLDQVGPLKVLFPSVWPVCPAEESSAFGTRAAS